MEDCSTTEEESSHLKKTRQRYLQAGHLTWLFLPSCWKVKTHLQYICPSEGSHATRKTEQPPLHLIYESPANAALWTKKQTKTKNLQHIFPPIFLHSSICRETLAENMCIYLSLHNSIAMQNKWNRGKHLNMISSFFLFLGSKGNFLTIPSVWRRKKKNQKTLQ